MILSIFCFSKEYKVILEPVNEQVSVPGQTHVSPEEEGGMVIALHYRAPAS
jgi:hypothetical protein